MGAELKSLVALSYTIETVKDVAEMAMEMAMEMTVVLATEGNGDVVIVGRR